jgi:hypothetical protein
MTGTKEFKNKIKNFKEPFDYSIFYDGREGKIIYTIHSLELKQLLFAENVKEGFVPAGAECKVELCGENIKKSISIAGNQSQRNQVLFNDLASKRGGFVVSPNSLSVQHNKQSLTHSVGLGSDFSQLTQQVPMYDANGNQIVGRENIMREVERRRAEEARKERKDKSDTIRQENFQDDGVNFCYEYVEVQKK